MLRRGTKRTLDQLVAEPSFRLRNQGDTIFGDATGYRSRVLSAQGALTPAGQYAQDEHGVAFPRQGIDPTRRTVWRGNSEFAVTQDGREIRLRTGRGELTARGKTYYTQPELVIEVPARQVGVGRLGEFSINTTRIYSEAETPDIGVLFRRDDNGTNTDSNPGFKSVKDALLAQFHANQDILAQESDMIWYLRDGSWIFRVRRRMENNLQVFRIPMNNAAPLKFEFMTRLRNMLPEALHPGNLCVVKQLTVLLQESAETISQTFDFLFPPFAAIPPYDGTGWRDTGIHGDLLKSFCEHRGIGLYLFFGNWKVHASESTCEKTITCFQWDGHSYMAQNSQYYAAGNVVEIRRETPARVRMERDLPIRKSVDFEPWGGVVRPGIFSPTTS